MAEVRVFIDMPESFEESVVEVTRQLKVLVDIIYDSIEKDEKFCYYKEAWNSTSREKGSSFFYWDEWSNGDGIEERKVSLEVLNSNCENGLSAKIKQPDCEQRHELWEAGVKRMPDRLECIHCMFSYVKRSGRNEQGFGHLVAEFGAEYCAHFHSGEEKVIRQTPRILIHVPKTIWEGLAPLRFIGIIKELCLKFHANYACMDDDRCPWNSGGHLFRMCSEEAGKNESRLLPGVYWAQYVTEELVGNTGSIEQVIKEAPCETAEYLEGNQASGAWLQLTSDVWNVTKKQRYAWRNYFKDSLPRFMTTKLVEIQSLWFVRQVLRELPLSAEEKKEARAIERMLKERELF